MRIIYERCAGLDAPKKTVGACRIIRTDVGEWRTETRTFSTMTDDLLALADWLRASGVIQVALESTGVFWRPVYNMLEGAFEVNLVNAKPIKLVPGRKTDVKDAPWIAELLQGGLLKARFIPEAPQRELRELVRYRTHLIEVRTREINRVQKVLEDANIKLASVATDRMGVSGREMLAALIAGQDDPAALAQLAKARMRPKIAELERALKGHLKDSHRLLLKLHLEHINDLNAKIVVLEEELAKVLPPFDQADLLARLQTIPGIGEKVAQAIVAEIGVAMNRFPSAGHLASWAGLVPGKNESAGRNRSSKTNKANRDLKAILVEAANTVGHQHDPHLAAQYHHLAARRGKKRAAVAVAHSILVIAYHRIRRGISYVDLGADYLDQRKADAVQHQLVKRLERLGFKVTLDAQAPAA